MTDNKTFGWCFIGTGTLARHVAKEIQAQGNHKIVSAYTRSFDNCLEFTQNYGGLPCKTPEEAILAPGVDGVYIVTPHNSHFQYAKLALELGKPVLCEKAFTMTAADADALIALAREKQLYLAEAMWTWFGDAAHQAKGWVDAGEIGKIRSVQFAHRAYAVAYAPRVSDPDRGGGALLDIGVYPITYAYRLFGYPTEIRCQAIMGNGIDLDEEIRLTFENGVTAQLSVSIVDTVGSEYMVIRGETGTIRADAFHHAQEIRLDQDQIGATVFHGKGGYITEFDRVAEEIRQGLTESSLVPLQATSDVMHICDECRRQMQLVYPWER